MIIDGIVCTACSCYFRQEALEPADVVSVCQPCTERLAEEADGPSYCGHCFFDFEPEELDRHGMCADCSADFWREFRADHKEAA